MRAIPDPQNAPRGTRTPVLALRGPRPGPLDDGGQFSSDLPIFSRSFCRFNSGHGRQLGSDLYPTPIRCPGQARVDSLAIQDSAASCTRCESITLRRPPLCHPRFSCESLACAGVIIRRLPQCEWVPAIDWGREWMSITTPAKSLFAADGAHGLVQPLTAPGLAASASLPIRCAC